MHLHFFGVLVLLIFFFSSQVSASISLPQSVKPNMHIESSRSLGIQHANEPAAPVLKRQSPGLAPKIKELAQLTGYFGLWYALTILYNITNKRVLNCFPMPVVVATVQLFLGIPLFMIPTWLSNRPARNPLDSRCLQSFWRISLAHGLGNIATTCSLEAGAVSFTHVIKAAEPVFSAALSAFILRTYMPILSYVALIPIVCGVALASLTETSFSWLAFTTAMLSNFFYQLRNVLSKLEFSQSSGALEATPALSAAQLFRVVTTQAAFMMIPVALLLEGPYLSQAWQKLLTSGINMNELLLNLIVSGFSYFLYNEVAFRILNKVTPVTHAVGNSLKRVVIIGASVIVLQSPLSNQGIMGSSIAVIGALAYSLIQSAGAKKSSQIAF